MIYFIGIISSRLTCSFLNKRFLLNFIGWEMDLQFGKPPDYTTLRSFSFYSILVFYPTFSLVYCICPCSSYWFNIHCRSHSDISSSQPYHVPLSSSSPIHVHIMIYNHHTPFLFWNHIILPFMFLSNNQLHLKNILLARIHLQFRYSH